MGRCRSPGRWRRPGPTGSRSRPSTRRSSCATRGVELPILVLYPIPPEQVAVAAAARIAVSVGSGPPSELILAAAPRGGCRRRARRWTCTWRSRRASGGAGRCRGRSTRSSRRSRRTEGARLAGVWTHLVAADDVSGTIAQDARFGAAVGRAGRGGRARAGRRPAPSRRQRRPPRRGRRALGRRPPRAVDLRADPRCRRAGGVDRRRGRRAAPGHGARRAAGPRRGPAGRPRGELRAVVRDVACVADRDAARGLRRRLAPRALRPLIGDRARRCRSRWSAEWRWTPSWLT